MKEQQTIRIPAEKNAKLKQEAQDMGMSYNSYVLMLISLGEKALRAIDANLLGKALQE
jgi:predicted DNA binding CopG/RHH family protein